MLGCLSIANMCVTWCADGTVESEGRTLLELEDVARAYKHPSIIDIKARWTQDLSPQNRIWTTARVHV